MMVLLSRYFKKRRPLAIATAMSGISVGSIAIPPLVRLLLDTYGIRGALLVYSGVALQMVVCSCLFRGTEEYASRRKLPQRKGDDLSSLSAFEMDVSNMTCSDEARDICIEVDHDSAMQERSDIENRPCREESDLHPSGHEPEEHDPMIKHDPEIHIAQKQETKRYDPKRSDHRGDDSDEHDPKTTGTRIHNLKKCHHTTGQEIKSQDRGRCWQCSRLATLLDVYMFRDPMFVMLVVVCGLSYLSIAAGATFLPALAGEMGKH